MIESENLVGLGRETSPFHRAVDVLLIFATLYCGVKIREIGWSELYTLVGVLVSALFVLFAQMAQVYGSWRGAGLADIAKSILLAWLCTIFVILLLGYGTKTSAEYSRIVVVIWFVSTPVALVMWRWCLFHYMRLYRERGFNTRSFVVLGNTKEAVELADEFRDTALTGMNFVGFFYDESQEEDQQVVTKAGPIDQAIDLAKSGQVEVVYIGLPLKEEERMKEIVIALSDTTASVYVIPTMLVADLFQSRWIHVGKMPIISVFETPFLDLNAFIKRVEDLVLTLVILPVVAIPMAIISAAIRLDSKGPILFKQARYGLGGKVISILKFRTMDVIEEGDEISQATKDDNRVTPVGRILRKYSLDELPQFINVLTGEMSVVGPRPHAVVHNEQYRKQIAGYMLRHKVKPGITGWAQVNGWRGGTKEHFMMQKRVEFDHWYINNWSVSLDLKIVFTTIIMLLKKPSSSAY